jgi:MFS family permease
MTSETLSRRTLIFLNIAHALDHFLLLIYPTAVIAISSKRGLDYASLITLATGSFIAFGLCSLPMGWISDRVGRRNMLAVFFFGFGFSCVAIAFCQTSFQFAATLFILGVFSAIYHPIGSAMLVTHARKLGRDLGINGVWGNIGAALASAVTAGITTTLSWEWAFITPGLICILIGIAFLFLVSGDGEPKHHSKEAAQRIFVTNPRTVLLIIAMAIIAGGMTFNMTTIALPKVIDEGMGISLSLAHTGSLATAVFMFGALTQLVIGRLVYAYSLPNVFVGVAILQPTGLAIAAITNGPWMLLGLVVIMSAIYGQVIINDAMVARYVPPEYRARAFSVRYFLGFTVAGFAAPVISLLHAKGGFPEVLGVAAGFGAVVASAALAFRLFAVNRAPVAATAAPHET